MKRFCVLLLAAALAHADKLEVIQSVQPPFEVAQWRLHDVEGDGITDLLLVGAGGEVRTWKRGSSRLEKEPRGTLNLPDPRYTLLALARVTDGEGPPQLVAVSPRGAVAYAAGADGAFDADPTMLARRARFRLRTNEPRFAEIVQDINRDQKIDLVVPGAETTELWLNGGKEGFTRAARIAIDVSRREEMHSAALSDEYLSSFRVPRLITEDVNGDGRLDLLVRSGNLRAFHMQRPDGTVPPEPDVSVDLGIFRDTTPRPALRPGRTLGGSDKTRYVSRDLDGDDIPDYVIAHRRKVWVFHGNKKQPQFVEPTTILKVSDDLTMLMVAHLDEDKYADLLLFKVQIPTMASLVVGIVNEFDIDISSLGYRNDGGRSFERAPAWRSELTVRVPPIAKLLKNPGALLAKFEDVGKKFRLERRADLDGDGFKETVLVGEDRKKLEVWRGNEQTESGSAKINIDRTFRQVLFEDKNQKWDFDRILSFLADMAERRTKSLTGGRKPDLELELRDPAKFEYLDYGLGDLDGDGSAELLVRYAPRSDPAVSVFDLVRLSR